MKLNIGETIKKLRKERDITQEEFARFSECLANPFRVGKIILAIPISS